MHPDIEKAINLIDEKITELQKAKQTLLEAFGDGINRIQPPVPRFFRRESPPLTRRDMLINLLKNEGALSRAEILEKTHFPLGTVATILNDKETFSNKDGKWSFIGSEENKKGLTDSQ